MKHGNGRICISLLPLEIQTRSRLTEDEERNVELTKRVGKVLTSTDEGVI
jgi:hypothetical protein